MRMPERVIVNQEPLDYLLLGFLLDPLVVMDYSLVVDSVLLALDDLLLLTLG